MRKRTLLLGLWTFSCNGQVDLSCNGQVDQNNFSPTAERTSASQAVEPDAAPGSADVRPSNNNVPNILLIIADDMGIEKVGAYQAFGNPVPTPNIDALAAEGRVFTRAYSNPVCTPTRATLLTGQYAFRYGIGQAVGAWGGSYSLDTTLDTIPKALDREHPGLYTETALGKWHLGNDSNGANYNPAYHGFDMFKGNVGTLMRRTTSTGATQDYDRWEKATLSSLRFVDTYNTTDIVDDAIQSFRTLSEPWFTWVAFNAPHSPFHVPPQSLTTLRPGSRSPIPDRYAAMVEAMDTEIGRMLSAMTPELTRRTVIMFVGDNGTPEHAALPPLTPSNTKHSLYEGGIHVPFIVKLPDQPFPGESTDALVNTTDVFATILGLAGITLDPSHPAAQDSVSVVHQLYEPDHPAARDYVYAETFSNGRTLATASAYERMIRDDRWKLIQRKDIRTNSEGVPVPYWEEEFYDMRGGALIEGPDLMPAMDALNRRTRRAYRNLKNDIDNLSGHL